MSTTTKKNRSDDQNRCISQFFRPKPPEPCEQNWNPVIVLDDGTDDEAANETSIIDLTEERGPEMQADKPRCNILTNENDEHDNKQISIMEKERAKKRSRCDERSELPDSSDQDLIEPPQNPLMVPKSKMENPFAKFAHGSAASSESHLVEPKFATSWHQHSSSSTKNENGEKRDVNDADKNSKRCSRSKDKKKTDECKIVKFGDIHPDEQMRIIRKWHSMADPSASLEVRRYQILLAARLHARCQEPTVRKAILKLREHFASLPEAQELSIDAIAQSDPEELANLISNLQFYNVKAKQIVKAAQEIKSRHGGIVPEDELSLLQITGIGKTFASLLHSVNNRKTHEDLATS